MTPRLMEVKSFFQCQGFNGRAEPETKSQHSWTVALKNYTIIPLSDVYLGWALKSLSFAFLFSPNHINWKYYQSRR